MVDFFIVIELHLDSFNCKNGIKKGYPLPIQEQRKFANENGGIYICLIENENILEKQKIRGEERNYDVTVP